MYRYLAEQYSHTVHGISMLLCDDFPNLRTRLIMPHVSVMPFRTIETSLGKVSPTGRVHPNATRAVYNGIWEELGESTSANRAISLTVGSIAISRDLLLIEIIGGSGISELSKEQETAVTKLGEFTGHRLSGEAPHISLVGVEGHELVGVDVANKATEYLNKYLPNRTIEVTPISNKLIRSSTKAA